MAHNFLEIEKSNPARSKSDLWRAIFTFLLLLFLGGFFFFQNAEIENIDNTKLSKVIKPLANLKLQKNEVGGDLEVKPPLPPKPQIPELVGEAISVSDFSAEAMLVKDVKTGKMLFNKNEYKKWSMASITKLMSALVILEKNPDWFVTTTVVGDDILGTHMYAGDTYTLDELWNAFLIASANKGVLTLANHLYETQEEAVKRMNQKAMELGMSDTTFFDVTGLDDRNKSTASDIALLLNEVMKFEKITQSLLTYEYKLYSKERNKTHEMWNTDWLLLGWIPNDFIEFYGGKTGFINVSGYNFTMRVGDSEGHLIDVVVLGTNSHEARFTEARDIAQWAFDNYKWPD